MHLDRLITLYLARPVLAAGRLLRSSDFDPATAKRGASAPSTRHLPILMYHSISDDAETGVRDHFKVCTSPNRFAEHMRCLEDWGYQGITLSEGLAWMKGGDEFESRDSEVKGQERRSLNTFDSTAHERSHAPRASKNSDLRPSTDSSSTLPSSLLADSNGATILDLRSSTPISRPVVLTFDDGFRDNLTEALPVLQSHGFAATIYITTGLIGESGDRRSFKGRECLNWDEVRELNAAGIELGSHTVNHPKLVDLGWDAIRCELHDSKAKLEDQLAHAVPAFAYPFAFPSGNRGFAGRLVRTLVDCGYQSCVTTSIGVARPSNHNLELPRHPANQADDPKLLRAKVEGVYDWVGPIQTVSKRLRRVLRR